jgi:cathepsin A (carboxypeptidase C)
MMLTEVPFLSSALCYLSEFAILGNPVYPQFNLYDIRKGECTTAFSCYDYNQALGMYVNSGKMRSVLAGLGEWQECNDFNRFVALLFAQYNYGHLLGKVLDKDIPVLVYNGDQDYLAAWQGAEAWTEAIPWRYQELFNT